MTSHTIVEIQRNCASFIKKFSDCKEMGDNLLSSFFFFFSSLMQVVFFFSTSIWFEPNNVIFSFVCMAAMHAFIVGSMYLIVLERVNFIIKCHFMI